MNAIAEPAIDRDNVPAGALDPRSEQPDGIGVPYPEGTQRPGSLHRYSLLADLLIVFVGLVTFLAPTDPDVWWHLRNGQLILEEGIPTHDVYSFTAEGRPWLVQEWLTEVLMHGVKSAFGYGALSLLFGLLQALGAVVVYFLLRRQGAGRILTLGLLMLYFVFAAPTWGVRPQVLTPVFLGTFFLVLLAYKDRPARTSILWALPALMALWANMHASYFIGVALVGAFLVGETANNLLYRPVRPTPLRPLVVTLAACLAATLLNPYFVELWTYPLTYVMNGTSNPLLRYTQEWQSPDFHEPGNLLFALSLVLLALVGVARRPDGRWTRVRGPEGTPLIDGRWANEAHPSHSSFVIRHSPAVDVTQAILLGAFALLALQAVRLVPLYGVIALPLLARGMAAKWPVLSRKAEKPAGAPESRVNLAAGAMGALALAYLVMSAPAAQTGPEPRIDTLFAYPVGAADNLAGLDQPVRLYNNFAWGGYLIYSLYPRQRVFIDGRADMYREGIFEHHMILQDAAPGWREVLAYYRVDHVMIVPGSALDYALSHEPGWALVYKDDVAVVYRKGG